MLAVAVAAAALAALPTVPQGNLIGNPGAEAGQPSQSGETTVPIPDWTTTSTFTGRTVRRRRRAGLLHVPTVE